MMKKILPNFKTTCIIVGSILILLSISIFGQGILTMMADYGVPNEVLGSPHYEDAISWVYLHTAVIGILIILFGISVPKGKMQKWIALVLFLVNSVYTLLDFMHSDSSLGNGLYKGEASVIPAFTSLLITLLFLQLAVRLFLSKPTTSPS